MVGVLMDPFASIRSGFPLIEIGEVRNESTLEKNYPNWTAVLSVHFICTISHNNIVEKPVGMVNFISNSLRSKDGLRENKNPMKSFETIFSPRISIKGLSMST